DHDQWTDVAGSQFCQNSSLATNAAVAKCAPQAYAQGEHDSAEHARSELPRACAGMRSGSYQVLPHLQSTTIDL
nr:hypothetical protein [Tanacetum cinerariifolium]